MQYHVYLSTSYQFWVARCWIYLFIWTSGVFQILKRILFIELQIFEIHFWKVLTFFLYKFCISKNVFSIFLRKYFSYHLKYFLKNVLCQTLYTWRSGGYIQPFPYSINNTHTIVCTNNGNNIPRICVAIVCVLLIRSSHNARYLIGIFIQNWDNTRIVAILVKIKRVCGAVFHTNQWKMHTK